jgi:hypothetical protein
MAFERHRDKNGQLSRKHGNTLIRTPSRWGAMTTIGSATCFRWMSRRLSKLVRDHDEGKLERFCSQAA